MAKSFVKVWTDILHDEWAVSLSLVEFGLWVKLLVLAKSGADNGQIVAKSIAHLAALIPGNRKTVGKIISKFERDGKLHCNQSSSSIVIEIINYSKWQELRGGVREQSGNNPGQKCGKNDLDVTDLGTQDQTRPDSEQTRPDKRGKSADADRLLLEWNEFANEVGLSKVTALSKSRKAGIRQRLREEAFDFEEVKKRIRGSPFLRGDNDRGWRADFDFVFGSPNNYLKILEGKYDQTEGRSGENRRYSNPQLRGEKPPPGKYEGIG